MKKVDIRLLLTILAISLFNIHGIMAQDDCEVLVEELKGEYEGDCRRGSAHGEGTARGEEATYTGEWRKGLPDGEGTYTYPNGDVYEGEFKKGLRDGYGELKVLQENGDHELKTGYWDAGEYVGKYKEPYEVLYRSPGVLSARITETTNPTDDGDAIFVTILHKGRTQSVANFGVNVNAGNLISRYTVGVETKLLVSQFPFSFQLSYMGESAEIAIYQQGSWKIALDFNK